jgi:hypothetical protein
MNSSAVASARPVTASRPRTIAAIFMTLLVAWNTAEFALQPVRRPVQSEILILIFTLGVLAFIPFIRANTRWSAIGGLVGTGAHWLFAILGLWVASASEGFGKAGPAVAAVLLTVSVYGIFQALRQPAR